MSGSHSRFLPWTILLSAVTLLIALPVAAQRPAPPPAGGPRSDAPPGVVGRATPGARLFPAISAVPPTPAPGTGAHPLVVRGVPGDYWADVIVGKPRFSDVSPFTTAGNKTFWVHGTIVDRSTTPNKLYVYDSGSNRILGFN